MADAPIVVARGLHKAFGTRVLLGSVALSIHDGERVGLLGINGSGKSTIAKILAGIDAPDEGDVAVRRDARVSYLAQEPSFVGDPTAHEAVLAGLEEWRAAMDAHEAATVLLEAGKGDPSALSISQAEAAAIVEREGGFDRGHAADAMLARLGISDKEQRVSTMSGGEQRRVALSRILVAEPTLAILDEPTNHLDADTVEWLEGYLARDYKGALLLVTHDRYLLDAVCTRTLELDLGAIHGFEGGWTNYLLVKAERLAHEARTEKNRQNFLRKELDWLRRSPKARSTKQKARVDRAESAVAAAPSQRQEQVTGLTLAAGRSGKTIVDLDDLTVDLGGQRLIDGLTLIVQKGERIGIVGPNGAGKTTLLRAILGELEPTAGRVVVGKNTRFGYFDQSRSGLDDDLSVRQNIAGEADDVTLAGGRVVKVVSWLDRFLFPRDVQRKKLVALSGGERARVAIAKLLLTPANLFLFDEPTNDLDVQTLGAVEEMILEQDGTALVVTHDRYFLDRIATSILAFEGDGRVVRYVGNYSDYRRLRESASAGPAKVSPSVASKETDEAASPKKMGLTYGEEIEFGEILSKIEAAEAEVTRLEAELADPNLYATRGTEVPELNDALTAARGLSEELISRWEVLEEKKE